MALPRQARNYNKKHFESFSGADMKVSFGNREIGEIQAISYAIQREKAPIYTLGHKNPRAFSRGKRGIAGTLVFSMFDSHAILQELGVYSGSATEDGKFLSDKTEYRPKVDSSGIVSVNLGTALDESTLLADDLSVDFDRSYEPMLPWFVDQIPPFDINVIAANEYGATIAMMMVGCELLNEAWGISVDDIVSEQQHSFVCRTLTPWRRTKKWHIENRGGFSGVYED